jgi:putative Holliday junction resolvase
VKEHGRLLGLDLGSRRIGVAVTDAERMVATGVSALPRTGDRARDHNAVGALVEEYGAVGVIVGVPYSMSGGTGPAAAAALEEVEELQSRLDVEVETVDERLTTVAASGALRASGRSSRAARRVVDQTAAAVLLQSWVDRSRSGAPRS